MSDETMSVEKANILTQRNQAAIAKSYAEYYINKPRGEMSYEEWDASQASWMWQMYYNSEKTIVELKQLLEEVHPLEGAKKTERMFQIPLWHAHFQSQQLARNMRGLRENFMELMPPIKRNDVEEYKAKMYDIDFQKKSKPYNAPFNRAIPIAAIYTPLYLYGLNSRFTKGITMAHNAVAKVITTRLNANTSKSITLKISSSDGNALEAVKLEYENLQKEIISLRHTNTQFSKDNGRRYYPEGQFELWDKVSKDLDAQQAEFLAAREMEDKISAEEEHIEALESLKLYYDNNDPSTTLEFESTLELLWALGDKETWLAELGDLDNRWVENARTRIARLERLEKEYRKIVEVGNYRDYNSQNGGDNSQIPERPENPTSPAVTTKQINDYIAFVERLNTFWNANENLQLRDNYTLGDFYADKKGGSPALISYPYDNFVKKYWVFESIGDWFNEFKTYEAQTLKDLCSNMPETHHRDGDLKECSRQDLTYLLQELERNGG